MSSGNYTPCGAISTKEITGLVSGLLELYRYTRRYDPEMGLYLLSVRRDLEVGPSGNARHALGSLSPSQSAISQWGWSFHIVPIGINLGDLHFVSGSLEL